MAKLIGIVGNLVTEESIRCEDDGITQRVSTKKGVSGRLIEIPVQNPFMLTPYRTFYELEQPTSAFILRVKDGSAALYEGDGGLWVKAARERICAWLRKNCSQSGLVVLQ
jgi:hypothetical protein